MPIGKELVSIRYVSDTDNGVYQVGELEWCSFNEAVLKDYIMRFGHKDLCSALGYLQFQVWQTLREINSNNEIGKSINA